MEPGSFPVPHTPTLEFATVDQPSLTSINQVPRCELSLLGTSAAVDACSQHRGSSRKELGEKHVGFHPAQNV